jgi:ferric-dicitrate binding protein FerR (iron transport regulator)
MHSRIDFDKIRRYCGGNFEEEDALYLYSLFSDHGNDADFQKYIREEFFEYINTEPLGEYDVSHLLGLIHSAISQDKANQKQAVLRCIYRWYSAFAAILLLPVAVACFIWFNSLHEPEPAVLAVAEEVVTTTVYAPLGSRISFTLPDSTVGWLNGGSSLTYSVPFNNNRTVIVSGEVWFDIHKDEHYPFEVFAGTSKIEVTGTKFNVSSYPDEEYVEVILEEGSVLFSERGSESIISMKPKERLLLKDGNIDLLRNIDVSKYTGWKEGKIIFRGDSMSEVSKRLERWYNVEIVLVDKELDDYIIRGTFQDDSLEEVFHFLGMLVPLEYHIIDQSIDKDGLVQSKKVLLKHKT